MSRSVFLGLLALGASLASLPSAAAERWILRWDDLDYQGHRESAGTHKYQLAGPLQLESIEATTLLPGPGPGSVVFVQDFGSPEQYSAWMTLVASWYPGSLEAREVGTVEGDFGATFSVKFKCDRDPFVDFGPAAKCVQTSASFSAVYPPERALDWSTLWEATDGPLATERAPLHAAYPDEAMKGVKKTVDPIAPRTLREGHGLERKSDPIGPRTLREGHGIDRERGAPGPGRPDLPASVRSQDIPGAETPKDDGGGEGGSIGSKAPMQRFPR